MKRAIIRFVSIVLALSVLLSMLSLSAFATPVTGRFFNVETKYTTITNTAMTVEANFTGNYYYPESDSNNLIVYGSVRGGPKDTYYTTLMVWVWDGVDVYEKHYFNSNAANSRFMEDRIPVASNTIVGGANGYVEASCRNKSNSSDICDDCFVYHWHDEQSGWYE